MLISLISNFLSYRYYDEEEMIDHVGGIDYLGQTTNTPAALMVNLKHFAWICNLNLLLLLF